MSETVWMFPEKEHPVLLQVICCRLKLSGSSQDRHRRSFFNLKSRKTLCHTLRRERKERCLVVTSLLCFIIPGRHQDESKLCLTNTLVLFSLHGKLARTADIIRSKTIFFLSISLVLPPFQADVHCCCSVVYPIRVYFRVFGGFLYCNGGLCVCANLHGYVYSTFGYLPQCILYVHACSDALFRVQHEKRTPVPLYVWFRGGWKQKASARFKSSSRLITNPIWEIWQQYHLGNFNYTRTRVNSHSGWIVSRYH